MTSYTPLPIYVQYAYRWSLYVSNCMEGANYIIQTCISKAPQTHKASQTPATRCSQDLSYNFYDLIEPCDCYRQVTTGVSSCSLQLLFGIRQRFWQQAVIVKILGTCILPKVVWQNLNSDGLWRAHICFYADNRRHPTMPHIPSRQKQAIYCAPQNYQPPLTKTLILSQRSSLKKPPSTSIDTK